MTPFRNEKNSNWEGACDRPLVATIVGLVLLTVLVIAASSSGHLGELAFE
jgi:hypothetical protein